MNLSRMISVPLPVREVRSASERRAAIAHYCSGGGVGRSHMGLLASIVAYLSVVAAIVIGFLLSADALLQHSHQVAADQRQEITVAAKTDALKTKKAVKPSRNTAEQRTIPQRSTATEYRRKAELSNTRSREPRKRTVSGQRQRRYWALQRERVGAPRALGYAEEPRFSGEQWQ
jgi:hypothetical protein